MKFGRAPTTAIIELKYEPTRPAEGPIDSCWAYTDRGWEEKTVSHKRVFAQDQDEFGLRGDQVTGPMLYLFYLWIFTYAAF